MLGRRRGLAEAYCSQCDREPECARKFVINDTDRRATYSPIKATPSISSRGSLRFRASRIV